jgi:hypothetical protein
VSIPDSELACADEFRQCSATIPVMVVNCARSPVAVDRIDVWLEDRVAMRLDPDPATLRPDEARRVELPVWRDGEYVVRTHYQLSGGDPLLETETRFRVSNPKREAALAACAACQGQWGQWGMRGVEGCNCRTWDAGKPCRDGLDCEGICLFDHFEVVRKASGPVCGASGCSATLGLGVPVGRCSEFRMKFGCYARIEAGASKQPPQTLPGRAPSVCVD